MFCLWKFQLTSSRIEFYETFEISSTDENDNNLKNFL